jgi:hypothetical protein
VKAAMTTFEQEPDIRKIQDWSYDDKRKDRTKKAGAPK